MKLFSIGSLFNKKLGDMMMLNGQIFDYRDKLLRVQHTCQN